MYVLRDPVDGRRTITVRRFLQSCVDVDRSPGIKSSVLTVFDYVGLSFTPDPSSSNGLLSAGSCGSQEGFVY